MSMKTATAYALALILALLGSAACAEQEISVSASRAIQATETRQSVRQALERELRRDALRKSPTIIEWDRDLRGEVYYESVKEMVLATVRLGQINEQVEVSKSGEIKLTLTTTAVVNDEEVRKWAARLDETERLRAELTDARRRESIATRREAGRAAERHDLASESSASSSVRMRLGDGADLADLARARSKAASVESREALLDMLRSAVIEMGPVRVAGAVSEAWTEFAFAMSWKLPGFSDLAKSYEGRISFKGDGGQAGMRFFERMGAATSAWKSADDLVWTTINLEVNTGAGKASVPVAYPAYRVSVKGEAACVETYGMKYDRHYPTRNDMGWCLAVDGSTEGVSNFHRPNIGAKSKVWVKSQDLGRMTGPEVTWAIHWGDGTLTTVKPVVRWAERVAQAPH